MNLPDRLIAYLAPSWAQQRARARRALLRYEIAQPSPYHRALTQGDASADAAMDAARGSLRERARDLEENHDVTVAVLDALVGAMVGTGLQFVPDVKTLRGEPHEPTNTRLRALWHEFWERPEVTREYAGEDLETLAARSFARDGELFTLPIMGTVRGLTHASRVPLSLELLEADFLPWDLLDNSDGKNIIHGVEKSRFGEPIAYHLYRTHPGNILVQPLNSMDLFALTHRVPAAQVIHTKHTRRLGQTRGVPLIHAVLGRIDHLRKLDEAILIKTVIDSEFAWFRRKDADLVDPDTFTTDGDSQFKLQHAMGFDLQPGEDVGTIESNSPNPEVMPFREANLRAVAGGTATSFSRISRTFDTSYAAQRAESTTQSSPEDALSGYFVRNWAQPIYRQAINAMLAAQLLPVPALVDRATIYDVSIQRGGGTPWVDPEADYNVDAAMIADGYISRQSSHRRRGIDSARMDAEIAREEATRPRAPEPEQPNGEVPDDTANAA